MRGSVRKRCSCPPELDARGRRKACTIKHGSWGYTVDLGPGLGPDGVHVERRQVTRFGFTTKKDAEKALAQVLDANGVTQAAPAPRFSRTPSGPIEAPPKDTTELADIGW